MLILLIKRVFSHMKKHWKEIAYYSGVMLALGVIAWGAESYRLQRSVPEEIPVTVSSETVEVQAEEAFLLPQGMQVCGGFSAEPVWNGERGCWQAHPAVDFICAENEVRAIGDGRVRTIGESGVYGGFIEVDSEEMLLRYCSVKPDAEMAVGMEIEKGEAIALADDSMPGEMDMGAHLHLEMVCSGEMMDILQHAETSD